MQNLLLQAYNLLKQDERLLSTDGDLLKNKIQELAYKLDEKLIDMLLSDATIKEKFFVAIKDVVVFDQKKFVQFINNKQFLPDSYTAFKNKIGLTDSRDQFVSESNDVVLDRPYKDCILAGGQDKEDAKRDEIFYNEVLGSDQIDRLLDPKVFTNFKRYTVDGEQKVENFKRNENNIINDNLIIKGNNLLALHSLKKQFAENIDLIYIDPPYNTGGNGDTFAYNNKFNHSSWLTFMKNRLEVAKKLLKKDGSLIVAIDKAEHVYLGVLLDEIFNDYESHCITIVHNPRGIQGTNFSYTNEYAFFVIPQLKKTLLNRKISDEDISFSNLRNRGSESERSDAKNCFYPILADRTTLQVVDFGDVCDDSFHPKVNILDGDFVWIYPIDTKGVERKRRYARQSVEDIKNLLRVKCVKGVYDVEIGKDFGQYKTVRTDKKYDANEYGTRLIKNLVPGCKFSFPKSLWNVYDCIYAIVGDKKEAIILDFFGGSGTTAHAVIELNKDDGGNRKFILTEQMDYINTVTVPRVKKVIENNGNGEFIYMEISQNNEKLIQAINNVEYSKDLISLYDQLKESSFINYKIDIKTIDAHTSEFEKLSVEDMKRFLIELIDKNALYINYSEINDENYAISEEDKALNKKFYQ